MTKALEEAFTEASKLPEHEQDALAAAILSEMKAEKMWHSALAGSQDALAELADEALEAHRSGKTQPLDPKKL